MTNLFEIAQKDDIIIEYCNLPKNESISVHTDDVDFILMDNQLITKTSEEKTHLAHEMGHCMTGSFYNVYSTLDIRQKHENRANKWAIENLISKQELDDAVAEGHTEVWDLAEYFDVTESFMRKVICWYKHGNLAVDLYMAV